MKNVGQPLASTLVSYRERVMAILHLRVEKDCGPQVLVMIIYNKRSKREAKEYLDLFFFSPRSVAW